MAILEGFIVGAVAISAYIVLRRLL